MSQGVPQPLKPVRNEGVICSNQIEGTSFRERKGRPDDGLSFVRYRPVNQSEPQPPNPVRDARVGGSSAKPSLWVRALSRIPLALWYPVARLHGLLRHQRDSVSPPRGREESRASFPEWDDATRERVIRDYYRGFADMLVEVMHRLRLTPRGNRAAREAGEPRAGARRGRRKGKPVLLLAAHQCNWEWMLLGLSTQLGVPVDAAYKPLVDSWAEMRDAQAARPLRRAAWSRRRSC